MKASTIQVDIIKNSDGDVLLDGSTTGKIWTEDNDGAGSGLDADLLDGKEASAFAQLDENGKNNADLLNGKDASAFAQLDENGKNNADLLNGKDASAFAQLDENGNVNGGTF